MLPGNKVVSRVCLRNSTLVGLFNPTHESLPAEKHFIHKLKKIGVSCAQVHVHGIPT